MIRKALFYVGAGAAVAATAAVAVVAVACSIYAVMEGLVGPAGAAATVAAVAAVALGVTALIPILRARALPPEPTLGEKAAAFARERPLAAAAAALAAGVIAVKNPKALLGLMMTFLEPKGRRRA